MMNFLKMLHAKKLVNTHMALYFPILIRVVLFMVVQLCIIMLSIY